MVNLVQHKNISEPNILIKIYKELLAKYQNTAQQPQIEEAFSQIKMMSNDNSGLSQDQAQELFKKLQVLAKELGTDITVHLVDVGQKKNKDNEDAHSNSNGNDNNSDNSNKDSHEEKMADLIDVENSNYHHAYLTPEEIFQQHVVGQEDYDAFKFFEQLCTAHHFIQEDKECTEHLFVFVVGVLNYLAKKENYTVNWDTFNSNLLFTRVIELYKEYSNEIPHVIKEEGEIYFEEILELVEEDQLSLNDLEDLEDYEDIVEQHNYCVEKIKEVFTLNENVKHLLLELQNKFTPEVERSDTYNIIQNIIYHGDIPVEKQGKIQNRILRSKKIISYLLNEQTTLHNIVQGLITKDANQFFAGLDTYVNTYLEQEETPKAINELSINDIICLFFSDTFVTIQSPKSQLASMIIELMFEHYDETIFAQFIERYNIPKNVVIRVFNEDNNKEFFLPLIEFALFTKNYQIIPSLLSLGFKLEPFSAKIIEEDQVYQYQYKPFTSMELFSENDLIVMIEHDLLHAKQIVDYEQVIENDSAAVSNNIFFYLAYQQYNDAFIRLYEKNKLLNPSFTTKEFKTYHKTDLLSYYLHVTNKLNAANLDMQILNIFMHDGYVVSENSSEQGGDVITALRGYEIDSLVDAVYYLNDIFPAKFKAKSTVTKKIAKKKEPEIIQWFDRSKLEQHFKRIEKDRDSANKEYIKNMLSNQHHLKKNLIVDDESFFDTLQNQFPNFEEVIRFYKSQFRLKKLSGKTRITPVLLLGEPGIGKTYFAKKLAQCLNTGYTFIDMASITANWILTGNNGSWKSAKQGKILEAMMNSPTINPIFLMDEIEKARGGDYDPTSSLYQLLEEINAKSFTDEFIDFSFDASGIIYIACANTLGNLSEPLQTRFKIINVPKPNSEQLDIIIHNIYHEAIQDAQIFSPNLDPAVIQLLKKETLRSIKVMVDEAVGVALLEMNMDEMEHLVAEEKQIQLELKHFQSPSKKKPMGFSK